MADRDITVWLNERWYEALEKLLDEDGLTGWLDEQISALIKERLPKDEYDRISSMLEQEKADQLMSNDSFSVFHVTENGEEAYYRVEQPISFLQAAESIRSYRHKPKGARPEFFCDYYAAKGEIEPAVFDWHAMQCIDGEGGVAGAFEIDFDGGGFSNGLKLFGWKRYSLDEVCEAADVAYQQPECKSGERNLRFAEALAGKETEAAFSSHYLRGTHELRPAEVSFADKIEDDDGRMRFRMDQSFPAKEVFRGSLQTSETDQIIIFASYSTRMRKVSDTMEIAVCRKDGGKENYKYRLTEREKRVLEKAMNAYSKEQTGLSLSEHSKKNDAARAANSRRTPQKKSSQRQRKGGTHR